MPQYKPDSNFIWCDVSTFDVAEADRFYSAVFGWKYGEEDGYNYATQGLKQVSGMFEMPEKLQAINMPSFWMSYISVADIEETVKLAKSVEGTIIEIEPFAFGDGKAALIRDPSGAGFTVWQGQDFGGKDATGHAGRMVWNELYTSDIKLVKPFYEQVFGWRIEKDNSVDGDRYDVFNPKGKTIATIEIMDEKLRGDKVFWLPYFAVADLDKTINKIESSGGKKVYEFQGLEARVALVSDSQDAAFGLAETGDASSYFTSFKLKTALALAFVYIAVVFNATWAWGLLFFVWLIPDLRSGTTYLAEPISRKSNPFWYWAIVGSWLWMSLYLIVSALI